VLVRSPDELPNIYHLKELHACLDKAPDYSLTCFFNDRDYRRNNVAAMALRGALNLTVRPAWTDGSDARMGGEVARFDAPSP